MDAPTGILAVILSLVSVVASGLLSLQLATVRTLRESNGDLRAANGDLKDKRAENELTIAKLEQEREVLASIVTGEVHLTRIEDQLDEHHREAMKAWASLIASVNKLEGKLP